jgi:hypothetical protein
MTSEGLGEMFEGDCKDTCVEKFPIMAMDGLAEGLVSADLGVRTPLGVSGHFLKLPSPECRLFSCSTRNYYYFFDLHS